jgi:hypothetical protein
MVWFSLALVAVFFIIVIGIDVAHFQFGNESYIIQDQYNAAEAVN